ncbi:hypothetical protein QWY90_03215 [Flavobacterium paronense]|uniref:Gliding motility protein GldL-like N-terminal domain-containing protein n=1 Tax=Flavobacterium paronense TaxID=1392775 RepID=A0ABV5GCK3_9FLAO|nr:hypothetical protein [Flavobacterium paronense]MDN3676317.1 hypothetical protein [Flavobacterium paronense]
MKSDQILAPSFISAFIVTIIAALLKINHIDYANTLLVVGLLLLTTFMILAIIEVTNSNKIDSSEKLLWVFGFLFFGTIVGFIYLLSARKRII